MKKFFISLLVLCLAFCALSFTACEETSQSTPEPPPAETPQPEQETEEVEELEHTVTTEFSFQSDAYVLLITEYYGNQIQKEVYCSAETGLGYCFEYNYDEQGVLETCAIKEISHLHTIDEKYAEVYSFFALEQGENGIFTGTHSETSFEITIETHENGTIKKREVYNEWLGTSGAEFDETGRRISDYIAFENFYNINCEYTYENDNKFSSSCTMTTTKNGEETSLGCTITRENELLTNVHVASAEISFDLNYLPNGSFKSSTVTYYNNGVISRKTNLTLDYNDTGLVAQAIEKRYNAQNQLTHECTYNYNEKGLETTSEQITYNADGSGYKYTKVYEYNSNGERTKSTSQTMEYINNAFLLKDTTVTEYTPNGSISTTTHYNTDGSYYIEVSEYENSGCKITTMHYDANGFLYTKGTREYKYVSLGNGAMGSVTIKSTITYYQPNDVILVFESEYNDDRKTTKETETKYTNGNIEYILTKTYEYDSDGCILVCKCVRCDGFGNIIEEWEE